MSDDDKFDKWLHQANKELIESISGSLDIDDALATVKHRATMDPDEASPDQHAAGLADRFRDKVLSLSIIRTKRPPGRRAIAARTARIELWKSRELSAILGVVAATAVFVLFIPIPGGPPPVLSFPAITGHLADIGRGDDPDDGGETGYAAPGEDRKSEPGRGQFPPPQPGPGAPAPGQPEPGQPTPGTPTSPEPASPQPAPGQPTHGETPPAGPGPVQPTRSEPTSAQPAPATLPPDTPVIQKVELSTQPDRNSVEIDSWRNAGRESNDLYVDTVRIYTELGAKLRIVEDSPDATYSRCQQITDWFSEVSFADLHKGSQLCAQSHTGRYAVLKVVTLPAATGQNGSFVFDGKTWQFPGQQPPAQPTPRQTPSPEATPGQSTSPPPPTGSPATTGT